VAVADVEVEHTRPRAQQLVDEMLDAAVKVIYEASLT